MSATGEVCVGAIILSNLNSGRMEASTDRIEVSSALTLRSRIRGRERWAVPCLLGSSAWAAAVETVLRGERGIRAAAANPVTGRVLIEFNPSELGAPTDILLQQALAFGPFNSMEIKAASEAEGARTGAPLRIFLSAEISCFLLKSALLGVCPWTVAAVVSAALVLRSNRGRPDVGIVVNQSRGVGYHENRAQVVKHRSDDWVNCAERGQA
jgi:hypothetical protein